MQRQWRMRIKGAQRKEVNIDLLVAAVMALGEQLRDEQHQAELNAATASEPKPNQARQEEA